MILLVCIAILRKIHNFCESILDTNSDLATLIFEYLNYGFCGHVKSAILMENVLAKLDTQEPNVMSALALISRQNQENAVRRQLSFVPFLF